MDLKKVFVKDACPTSVGGQAIIEGIMMRSPERTAIGIRLPDGRIFMKTEPSPKGSKWGKVPLIRGVVNFVASLVQGTKVLMYSADKLEEFYPEGYEKDKFDVWVEEKVGKEKAWKILMVLSVVLAIVMSAGLFMVLPTLAVGWLSYFTDSILLKNLVEGLARIIIFMLYVALIAKMPDIKTVFQYHGAEHKAIHCFEKGLELTPENAQSFYTVHPRCGTSFLVFVMIIAVLVHAFMGWPSVIVRVLSRILVLPVIAGLSYELLRWAGRSSSPIVKVLSLPGLYVQKLTTREPENAHLEVAIAAMKACMKPEGTPFFEGICDLNGDPVEENETSAAEEPADKDAAAAEEE